MAERPFTVIHATSDGHVVETEKIGPQVAHSEDIPPYARMYIEALGRRGQKPPSESTGPTQSPQQT